MPIMNIKQPETIMVSDNIRLRKFYASYDFTLPWYQNENTVYMMDGKKHRYSLDEVGEMYRRLDSHGELYFIEVMDSDNFRPIGDVTLTNDDIMIVIGDLSCRNKGIGKSVILAIIQRARELGFSSLSVKEIYDFNIPSQKCFLSAGFSEKEKTPNGHSYCLQLK